MDAHVDATRRYQGQQMCNWLAGLRTAAWGDADDMRRLFDHLQPPRQSRRAEPPRVSDEMRAALAAFGLVLEDETAPPPGDMKEG